MTAEKFWSGWLRITTLIMISSGILLVLLYNLGATEFLDSKIDKVFFDGNNPGAAVHDMRIWMISVAGSVMVGWGLIMLYIVNHPFKKREKWAWRSIFYPILIWYILDNSISLHTGVMLNVVINTVIFLQIVAPLLFLRNSFFSKNPS